MNALRLCIDFGSAYTKVALRREAKANTELVTDGQLNLDAMHFCIPTIVASKQEGSDTRWVGGLAAADLKEANGVRVYRDWKSRFFTSAVQEPAPAAKVQPAVGRVAQQLAELRAIQEERSRL